MEKSEKRKRRVQKNSSKDIDGYWRSLAGHIHKEKEKNE